MEGLKRFGWYAALAKTMLVCLEQNVSSCHLFCWRGSPTAKTAIRVCLGFAVFWYFVLFVFFFNVLYHMFQHWHWNNTRFWDRLVLRLARVGMNCGLGSTWGTCLKSRDCKKAVPVLSCPQRSCESGHRGDAPQLTRFHANKGSKSLGHTDKPKVPSKG